MSEELVGKRRLLAARLRSFMCRLAGCECRVDEGLEEHFYDVERMGYPGSEKIGDNGGLKDYDLIVRDEVYDVTLKVLLYVLEARKGSCSSGLSRLSELMAAVVSDGEVARAVKAPLESETIASRLLVRSGAELLGSEGYSAQGLQDLVSAARRFALNRSLDDMVVLALRASREASRRCSSRRDLLLLMGSLERRVKLYGLLFWAILPSSLILAIAVNPLILLPAGIALLLVWAALRREGSRLTSLGIELAWSECRLTGKDLVKILNRYSYSDLLAAYLLLGRPG